MEPTPTTAAEALATTLNNIGDQINVVIFLVGLGGVALGVASIKYGRRAAGSLLAMLGRG